MSKKKSAYQKYREAVSFFMDQENPGGIDPRRKLLRAFLTRLGNPQKTFKYIHVTGTSGKGSTVMAIHEILRASGRNVASMLSPGVTTLSDRFHYNKRIIKLKEFNQLARRLRKQLRLFYASRKGSERLSFHELMFVMAVSFFAKKQPDIVVMEVFNGGFQDMTTKLLPPRNKVASVITNVGMDHANLLGNSKAKIAYQKSGIIVRGVPAFTTEKSPRLLKIFQRRAKNIKAKLTLVKPDPTLKPLAPSLHQLKNYSLAAAVAKHLKIPAKTIFKALGRIHLPGRMELVAKKPKIIVDGAHNLDKIKSSLRVAAKTRHRRLIVIISLSRKKSWKRIIRATAKQADTIYLTNHGVKIMQPIDPELIRSWTKTRSLGARIIVEPNPNLALKKARNTAKPNDLILITGSIYMVARLRKLWYPEKNIVEQANNFPG